MSEGVEHSPQRGGTSWQYGAVFKKIWPFLPGLIGDYLKHASPIEKVILVLLVPIKLLNAYLFGIKKVLSTQTKTNT
jgi:hypothetical protein